MHSSNIAKRSFLGVAFGFLQFGLTFIQNLLIVPFILHFWSAENYGIWLTCYAFIILMRTIDAGHQTFIGNEFLKAYNENIIKAKEILGSSIKISFFLGFIEVCIFLIAIIFKVEHVIIGISSSYLINIGIFSMLVSWWLIGSAAGILIKCFLPVGLFNRTIYWSIIYKIIELGLLVIAVFFGWEIWEILIIQSILFLLYCIIALIDIKSKIPSIYPWWEFGTLKQGLNRFYTSLVLTFNGFIEQFSTNGLLILIGNLASIATIPLFTTLRTASNVFLQINQITINPLVPDIVRMHALNEKHKIVTIFNANWYSLNFFLILPILISLPFLNELYELWTRQMLVFDKLLSYSLMMSIVIICYGKVLMTYLSSINHFPSLVSTNILRGLILFPSAYLFLKFYTISYLGIAICMAEIFASILLPAFFSKRLLNTELNLKGFASYLMSGFFLFIVLSVDYCEILTGAKLFIISILSFALIAIYQWRNNVDDILKKYIYHLGSNISSKFN